MRRKTDQLIGSVSLICGKGQRVKGDSVSADRVQQRLFPQIQLSPSIQAATARRNRSCAPSARPTEKNGVYSRQPARLMS